jgi:PST family polysaccharide transporter
MMIFFGAPLLVHFILGRNFQDTIPALRVFAFWIPLCALTTVATFQLLLPNQLDKQFNIVNFSAVSLNIVAALFLAPRFGAVGIAASSVIGQSYTLVAFAIVLARAGLNPFASTARMPFTLPASQIDANNQELELLLHERLSEAEPHTF